MKAWEWWGGWDMKFYTFKLPKFLGGFVKAILNTFHKSWRTFIPGMPDWIEKPLGMLSSTVNKPEVSKKHLMKTRCFLLICYLLILSAGNFAGFQCASAYVYALRLAIYQDTNFLNVNAPRTTVAVVSMRYVVTSAWFLTCHITFARHRLHLLVPKHLHKTILLYLITAKNASSTIRKNIYFCRYL